MLRWLPMAVLPVVHGTRERRVTSNRNAAEPIGVRRIAVSVESRFRIAESHLYEPAIQR